jgi:uncharacterized radical SAM superfamily protein
MQTPSAETLWAMSEKPLLSFLNTNAVNSKRRHVTFYIPGFSVQGHHGKPDAFPTLSITGKRCALRCKHCEAKVLKTMLPAETPTQLYNLCEKLKQKGASGCLISGGCQADGKVPIDKFIPIIKRVTKQLNLKILVHTGLVDFTTAEKLKDAGVKTALIDIVGADETIHEICGLECTTRDYEEALDALQTAGLTFVPHIIVGLHNGKLKGELQALNMVAKFKPSALVVIAFMPIPGTSMAQTEPPKPIEIARVISIARCLFNGLPIALGCMRPKGKHRSETDVLALKAGVDAVAFPAREAVKYAEGCGYQVDYEVACCSQVYEKLAKWINSKQFEHSQRR